jgi:2-oxoglutarate dehydrogenase E1 component
MSTAFLAKWNEEAIEKKYDQWRRDPTSLEEDWNSFFEGFELGFARDQKRASYQESSSIPIKGDIRVENLVNAYRTLGHTMAQLNPLDSHAPSQPQLEISEFGFSNEDLEASVFSPSFRNGEKMTLQKLIEELRSVYCGTSTVEFMHIQDPLVRNWVRDTLEQSDQETDQTSYYRILRTLHKAELFENFLHTTYVGSKRFSIEGGESMMVVLSEILRRSPEQGIKEIVLGMAHRGRLNVLANFLKKPFAVIFNEFSDEYRPEIGDASGDVKYHLGYHTTRDDDPQHPIEIYLAANPSHLEAVNPVVMGKVRARQRILNDTESRRSVVPILIHGDAAFIGQGIVAECLNLSQLPGYRVGGTLHLIVNNQIGFTTLPADARSTTHCTDIMKFIEAPIFHVNGDDPLAVCRMARYALAFRQQFGRDVALDVVCYRRYGHNEGDEPSFTQPNLYKIIKDHPRVSEVFLKQAFAAGTITEEEAHESRERTTKHLQEALQKMKKGLAISGYDKNAAFVGSTAVFQPAYNFDPVETAISKKALIKLVDGLTTIPEAFRILPKIKKNVIEHRQKILEEGGPYDWAFGETLAFASLLVEGTPVRLSGQDSRRGTFSQRHSVFYDEVTRERFIPLLHLDPNQERFCVYNSPLSEASVLGFDYGYSMDFPKMLCIWEAQFGDFANGAQVIIDQFIASSETKWLRPSSLVMLLPHGYEGMGPEHSSGRLERFLQLCAEENIQVCNPTTPAQYFHLLRRQMRRAFRKPLIIMTPKKLLRLDEAVSKTEDFTEGHFQEILLGPTSQDPLERARLIFCTGKVYYDLLAYQQTHELKASTLLIRVEQLYPLHQELLEKLIKPFLSQNTVFVWCQEEPENMGAYQFIKPRLESLFNKKIIYAGREASASTAVGALSVHHNEQSALVKEAFEK